MRSSIREVSRARVDLASRALNCKDPVSEVGLEPIAYAGVLSAEFALGASGHRA
jgi:hypothetical protein